MTETPPPPPAVRVAVRVVVRVVATVAGVGAAAVIGVVAALRHDRPIHAVGRTFHARLERPGGADVSGAGRPGAQRSGVPWIDDLRGRSGLVRFSRGAGLPERLPDVQGLAIRVEEPDGYTDLLLASSGLRGPARFALVPRWSPLGGPASTLMPFQGPRGPVVIAAEPTARAGRDRALTGTRWRLLWSGATGPWHPFAVLSVGADAGPTVDRSTRFDPVAATPPGLPSYRWARLVRTPAYRLAQALGRPRPAR